MASVRLEANELRNLYEEKIWKQKLLPAIRDTLKRAELELAGKPISIVLLSGGSSNIRWFKPLLERDLKNELRQAEVLELSENFQEIVSKGLAVECARRFHTDGEGDFRAVTYNRLCLGLKPNSGTLELKPFVPESPELEGIRMDPGVLMPSATSLRGLIGRPMRWKVRLNKAPTQTLDYYFMRSSFDPDEINARHNLDSQVATPKNVSFASSIEVELLVREDGTAEPSFVYGRGSQSNRGNTVVRGRPFYMDMTFAAEESGGQTYLGFDFGTSTSSLCYVDANDVRVYSDRGVNRTWIGLSALSDTLPYPVAHPLARFLSETSASQMEHWGRETLEAMLCLAAYLAYLEHCSLASLGGGMFKAMRQRSAGPLWKLFKDCAKATGDKWQICREMLALTGGALSAELEHAVSQVAQTKHGKTAQNLDYPRILEQVGNVLAKAFHGKVFGYFEDAKRKPFSMNVFQGIFRSARGQSSPFIDFYNYEGKEDFPSEFVFLVDVEGRVGLSLFPLIVRGIDHSRSHQSDPDLFLFDIVRASGKQIAFKAVQERPEVIATPDGALSELFESANRFLEKDQETLLTESIKLTARSLD